MKALKNVKQSVRSYVRNHPDARPTVMALAMAAAAGFPSPVPLRQGKVTELTVQNAIGERFLNIHNFKEKGFSKWNQIA